MDTTRNEQGHGRSRDWKHGWGVQNGEEFVELLSSALQPALLRLTFKLRYYLDDLHLINISCKQNMGSTSCCHLMAYKKKKRGGGGTYGLLTRCPAIFIVLFPAGFFLLFNFSFSFDAIYCVTQLTSRPFLHHVSQSCALFLPPAPHIQLTQDKLN